MKESDKGLLAVAVFIAIFYLSKKDNRRSEGYYDFDAPKAKKVHEAWEQ